MSDPIQQAAQARDLWISALQALSWAVASIGGVITAYKAVHELHVANSERARAREDKERELLWRMAEKAQLLLSALGEDSRATTALELADVDGNFFESSGLRTPLSHADLRHALRVVQLNLTPLELEIRKCFDRLLMRMADFEHMISIGLVEEQHIAIPLAYYGRSLSKFKSELSLYASTFGFEDALRMLGRLPGWTHSKPGSQGVGALR